jgi:hypothetical protein
MEHESESTQNFVKTFLCLFICVQINVNKNPYAQINYGTGKDVSDEDISDAKIPLQIKWQNDSWVKIPIWK